MGFRLLPIANNGLLTVEFSCSANNPCASASIIAGDIDYRGTVRFDRQTRTLEFDGKIDDFPAFEAYATINDGAGFTLFTLAPPQGNTVMNLPGPPRRSVRFRAQDKNGDAVFDTLTPF
jgi:hypothetical protein